MPPAEPSVDDLLDLAVGALGGARRDGQHTMATAVADALESGEHLLVQAGTGTGKSLGYLVPAVRHAVLADERVVVSTATLALQRQVVTRDLPLVADALAPRLPRAPRIALLKGWHNYACVHKVAGGYPDDEPGTLFDLGDHAGAADHPAVAGAGRRDGGESLGEQVVRLREWAQETATGDRDDLVPGVTDRAWSQVSVTSLECLGTRCPMIDECFPERARAAAREADVVVTNHAMLGIAASGSPGVLPEHDVLVVDEAHELTDRVTAQATSDLSIATVEHAARLARRHGGVPTTDLDTAGQALAAALVELPEGRFPDGLPDAPRAAVAAVRDASRTLLSVLKPEPAAGGKAAPPDGGLKMAASAMLALFEVADRMAADPEDTRHTVLWCARSEDRRGAVLTRLHAAPLAVNGLIRTHLLAGRTGVLTSATLSIGGSFDPVARSVGLEVRPDAEPVGPTEVRPHEDEPTQKAPQSPDATPTWRGLDVGSPFDYPRQGILYVARRLPPPGREPATDAQLDEIEALVRAAGGRTLGLFSSRRAATAAALALRERLDVPVLLQGDDQLPTLVAQFAADEPTCLFGTLSLWQGVDVPGPTCRLVLIDRIPFPRPDDPVRSARAEAVAAAGGNGFMSVSATHAALLLAQGAGRLVRTVEDRGVVAVLDPRLSTARYGDFLARSLPAFWRTTERDVAVSALQRLAAAD
ncbi:ATP-dependent DNA helicase [Cellulomonas fimi]|uniref:ATP-dependent helicase DinG n=1 Tax=Cellulomonas fimi (strain ATCC 484 / DSM 20113 / JCM 1341 / CCUG 24087 / LMG 16345 / NBRC 15513 / NCIMB 8980 / NCTC 7547 / NRS-133) TaxID=590998 RepID=F4H784_CELFA|nr:ATP-dependent DNA helicase [Cellulomonas fimi]AEE45718.1 helicase c2 [Cellulomonas fimi ATCC 484]VEH30383.1 Probable ATP-dependent helicase dinG homolog [Cellulomonas fimi]